MCEPIATDAQEFLTSMIRQARTSLAAINGYVSLIAEATADGERQQYEQRICSEAGKLLFAITMILRRLGLDAPARPAADDEKSSA
jgi:signal transduction histidine kinase